MSLNELVELILEKNGNDYEQTKADIDDIYLQMKLFYEKVGFYEIFV